MQLRQSETRDQVHQVDQRARRYDRSVVHRLVMSQAPVRELNVRILLACSRG